MIIDAITRRPLDPDSIDYELGYLESELLRITYRYVLENLAIYKEVVIREYPETGGKDVELVEVSPEIGHWEMVDSNGEPLDYPIEEDLSAYPKDLEIEANLPLAVYTLYTHEELEERKAQIEAAILEEKANQQKVREIEALPDRVSNMESMQEDIVLLMADILGGAA